MSPAHKPDTKATVGADPVRDPMVGYSDQCTQPRKCYSRAAVTL